MNLNIHEINNLQYPHNDFNNIANPKIKTNAQLKTRKNKFCNGRNNKDILPYEKEMKKNIIEAVTLLNKANLLLKSNYSK
jgi:hypothetical protein